jgi:uncharacterized OsmC-like protein
MPEPFEKLTVEIANHDRFVCESDQGRFIFAAPNSASNPTPVEGFIGALGSCMGLFAMRYCRTAGIDPTGLRFEIEWLLTENPHRVGEIRVMMHPPHHFPPQRLTALLKAAKHCTVHNTLMHPPTFSVTVSAPASASSP